MPQPRSSLVSLSDTPWYHVVSRCVRRAYLCGEDAHSGRSFEHRRGWIAERLQQLAGVFAVDVAAYAVMSNHFHVVVRIDAERVRGWDADEVLRRWTRVFAGPLLVQRYLADRRRWARRKRRRSSTGWRPTAAGWRTCRGTCAC
jgi:hypothetical protein